MTILRTLPLKSAIWPKRAAHDPKRAFCTIFIKTHCFPFLERISDQCDDFETLTLKNAIWPKRAAHDLKRAFCTIFMESALFSRFEENFRPVSRF